MSMAGTAPAVLTLDNNPLDYILKYPEPLGEGFATRQYLAAIELYALGLNVFPQPYGKKDGFRWKATQYTRVRQFALPVLFAGQCNVAVLTGRTSRDLFVLDCETQKAFDYHRNEMAKRGIPCWAYRTQRGGHIWFFSASGTLNPLSAKTLPDAELRSGNGYVLVPPSMRSETGTVYTWISQEGPEPPTVTREQMDWLLDVQGNPVRLTTNSHRGRVRPSDRTWRKVIAESVGLQVDGRLAQLSPISIAYLEHGESIPEGRRNKALFNAACDLKGCGYTLLEAEQSLLDIAVSSGLDHDEVVRSIKSAFSKARTPRNHFRRGLRVRSTAWEDAQAYIASLNWSGQAGITDREVAAALVERARKSGNPNGVFRASQRELAEAARKERNTIKKSLKRLQSMDPPLIAPFGKRDHGSNAMLWYFPRTVRELGRKLRNINPLTSNQVGGNPSGSIARNLESLKTDAAERRALGPTAVRVYQVMGEQHAAISVRDLQAKTNFKLTQIRRALTKLRQWGLVRVPKYATYEVTAVLDDEALDKQVAAPAGTLGRGYSRRQRHKDEREGLVGRVFLWDRQRFASTFPLEESRCEKCGSIAWKHRETGQQYCERCDQARIVSTRTRLSIKPYRIFTSTVTESSPETVLAFKQMVDSWKQASTA